MFQFIIKRLFNGLIALITVIVIISALIYASPIDPARLTFGQNLDEETLALKKKQLGLDQSFTKQLALYLRDISPLVICTDKAMEVLPYEFNRLAHIGSYNIGIKPPYFRSSFQSNRPVVNMVFEVLPNTFLLALFAIIIASFIGIILGIIAALNKGSRLDGILMGFATLGYSVPSYVSAIFFSIVFGYLLHEYTGLNMQGSLRELNELGDEILVPSNLILPALALGIRPIAVIMQLTRSAMLDVLSQNFIKTALAKGVDFTRMIRKHALKNAMNPVATSISGWFASLLSGAFFVENVFNYQGLGKLTVNALIMYDIPLLLACIIVTACIFILINLLMDFVYLGLDPRAKIS